MADTLARRMSLEDFLAWEARQETRNEFVGGRIRAMVGGTRRHNRIAQNVVVHLVGRLKGSKCHPFGGDMKIITPAGNVRYGDVTVDCGPQGPNDIAASEPTVVVEVLSKSTAWVDQSHKLDDYQSIPSMRHILHLSQEKAEGELWSLGADGWRRAALSGLEAEVDIAALGVRFTLAVAYEGAPFEEETDAS